jgi:predicted ATPase
LSAQHALSRDVVDDVAERTGGVPLFVEEVTRLLLERGEQRVARRRRVTGFCQRPRPTSA